MNARSLRYAKFLFTALCLYAVLCRDLPAAPALAYPQPQPSNQEQYLLERIDAARANPAAEGKMLANLTDADIVRYYQYYNVTKNQLIGDFSGYAARPPLAFNARLMTAAREHSLDQAAKGFQGHNGTDGSSPDQRVTAAAYKWSAVGENVYAYALTPFFAHVGLMADWGVPTLDHRKILMNLDPSMGIFREIGISAVPPSNPAVGPLVVTEDFASPADAGVAYLVGVVYTDANGNGAYDAGEGLGGVTVTPDGTDYYAVTTASGGYVIPLPASGAGILTITASGGDLEADRVQTVGYTAGTNVKADFVAAPSLTLPVVTLSTTTPTLALGSNTTGVVTLSLPAPASKDVVISYTLKGSAINGTDYVFMKGTTKIKAGKASKSVKIVPTGDLQGARKKAVKLVLAPGTGYGLGTSPSIKIQILAAP